MANTMVGIIPRCVDYISNVTLDGFQFGHLEMFGVKLGYLRINGKQMFALSQVLADLFKHVPRTTIRKRMEYLKIKRRRCDLQELRTLKAIKSVPTRAVKCTLISKEDLEALYTVYKAPECTRKKFKVREKEQFASRPDSGYFSGFCSGRAVLLRTRNPAVQCKEESEPAVESTENSGLSGRPGCRPVPDPAGRGFTNYENVGKSSFCPVYRERDAFYQDVACRYPRAVQPAIAVRFNGAGGPVHFRAKYSCCNQSKNAGSGFIGNYNSSLPPPALKSVKRMVLSGDIKPLSETRSAQPGQGASLGSSSDSDCSLDPENDSDFGSTDEDEEGESLLSGCSSDDESSSASDSSSAFSGASLHSIRFRRATLPSLCHKPSGIPGQPGPEERPELTAVERQSLYAGVAPQSRPFCRQPGHGLSINAGDKNGFKTSAKEVTVTQPEPERDPTQLPHLTPNNFAKRGASLASLKASSQSTQQRDLLHSDARSGASAALCLSKDYLKPFGRDQALSPTLNARPEGRIKQTFKSSDLSQNSAISNVNRTHLRAQQRVESVFDTIHKSGVWNLGESEGPGNYDLKRKRRKAELTSGIHLNENGGVQSVRGHNDSIHRSKHSTSTGVQNRSTLQSKVSAIGRWENGTKKKQVSSRRDKQLTSKRCPGKTPDVIQPWLSATGKRANLLKDSAKCKRVTCGLATPVKKAFSLMGNFPSPPSLVVGDDGDLCPAYSFCSDHSCSMQKAHPVWRWQIGGTAIPLPPSHKFRGFSI